MRHWKKLNEKEFKELKALLSLGLKPSKLRLVGVTERSNSVFARIEKAGTFQEYIESMKEETKKYPKHTNRTVPAISITDESIQGKLDHIIALLEVHTSLS